MRPDRLLLVALLGSGCHDVPEKEAAPPPRKVTCAPVQQRTVTDAIDVRGAIAPLPDRDALVAPQATGRLTAVLVREGDAVKSGQIVARVDDAPLADALHQADSAVARVQAELSYAEATLSRVRKVFEKGIAPRQEVDDAAAKVSASRAALTEAEIAARQAHRTVERAVVRSPLAGVVLKVLRKAGELVDGTPATPVLEIADTSQLELAADVPAQDLVRAAKGARAEITIPALPGVRFEGTVSMVSPAVDRATGVGTLRLAITASKELSPPIGAYGLARIRTGASRDALLVPAVALRSAAGGSAEVVLCGSDSRAHVKRVQLGPARGEEAEVKGVAAGERVAVAPVLGLVDGEPIEAAR